MRAAPGSCPVGPAPMRVGLPLSVEVTAQDLRLVTLGSGARVVLFLRLQSWGDRVLGGAWSRACLQLSREGSAPGAMVMFRGG